jgi:hypothetical protein
MRRKPGAGGMGRYPWRLRLPGLLSLCWICSLDGALPLGQEALISCGGGGELVGIRSRGIQRSGLLLILPGTIEGHSFSLGLLPQARGGRKECAGQEAQSEARERL